MTYVPVPSTQSMTPTRNRWRYVCADPPTTKKAPSAATQYLFEQILGTVVISPPTIDHMVIRSQSSVRVRQPMTNCSGWHELVRPPRRRDIPRLSPVASCFRCSTSLEAGARIGESCHSTGELLRLGATLSSPTIRLSPGRHFASFPPIIAKPPNRGREVLPPGRPSSR